MRFNVLLPVVALSLCSACETVDPTTQSTDAGFGETLKYDMAIQTINPDPVYDEEGAQPGDSGARAAEATKRYRTDRVKDANNVTTGGVAGSGPM